MFARHVSAIGGSHSRIAGTRKLCSCESFQILAARLRTSVEDAGYAVESTAFGKVSYLGTMHEGLHGWIRRRVSMEVITAERRLDLIRLDVLCSRLPSSCGARVVFERAIKLRWLALLSPRFAFQEPVERLAMVLQLTLVLTCAAWYLVVRNGLAFARGPALGNGVVSLAFIAVAALMSSRLAMLICRDVPHPINLGTVATRLGMVARHGASQRAILLSGVLLWATLALYMALWFIGKFFEWPWTVAVAAACATLVIAYCAAFGWVLWRTSVAKVIYKMRIKRLLRNALPAMTQPVVLSARSQPELREWLRAEPETLLREESVLRSLLSVVSEYGSRPSVDDVPLDWIRRTAGDRSLGRISSLLVRHAQRRWDPQSEAPVL